MIYTLASWAFALFWGWYCKKKGISIWLMLLDVVLFHWLMKSIGDT